MINLIQTNLVLRSKPLKDQNIKQTEELSNVYHEHVDIAEELEKAAC